jgi:hypothetical protein
MRAKTVHKKRGRPAGSQYGETIPVRLELKLTKAVDGWAKKNALSRSSAIRKLLALGLTVPANQTPKRVDAAALATATAGAERAAHAVIDRALKDHPEHVRAARKKRLTTMPGGVKRR